MNCEQLSDLMHAALDDELAPLERKQLQRHLESCEACRSLWHQLQAVDRGLAWLAEDSDRRVAGMGIQSSTGDLRTSPWRWSLGFAAAAAVILAGVVLVAQLRSDRGTAVDHTMIVHGPSAEPNPCRFELRGDSFDQYIALPQRNVRPRVHVVWLYRTAGLGDAESSSDRAVEPLSIRS